MFKKYAFRIPACLHQTLSTFSLLLVVTLPVSAQEMSADGLAKAKDVYANTCVTCHSAGVAGAPKLGDKAAWASRLKTGKEALYKSALKGKKSMPPKGGHFHLSDDDVKLAVDYMIATAQ